MYRIFPFTVPSLQQDVGLRHHCRRWLIHSEMQNAVSHPCGRTVIHATFKRNYAYWDIPFCQTSSKQSIREDGKVGSGTGSKNMGKKAQSHPTDCLQKFMGTLPLLFAWSALLKQSHVQGFVHWKTCLDITYTLGFFKMHRYI